MVLGKYASYVIQKPNDFIIVAWFGSQTFFEFLHPRMLSNKKFFYKRTWIVKKYIAQKMWTINAEFATITPCLYSTFKTILMFCFCKNAFKKWSFYNIIYCSFMHLYCIHSTRYYHFLAQHTDAKSEKMFVKLIYQFHEIFVKKINWFLFFQNFVKSEFLLYQFQEILVKEINSF